MARVKMSVLVSIPPEDVEDVVLPLSSLFRDPLNVRKTGGEDVATSAALIAAHGLLQNLIVRVELKHKKDTGRHGVVAGGRRLRALELLHSRGQLSADHPVRCRLVSQERGLAVHIGLHLLRWRNRVRRHRRHILCR